MSDHSKAVQTYFRKKQRALARLRQRRADQPPAAPCWLCFRTPAGYTADLHDCRGPLRSVRLCEECFGLPEGEFVRRCVARLGR
jgi:hypothetical protein